MASSACGLRRSPEASRSCSMHQSFPEAPSANDKGARASTAKPPSPLWPAGLAMWSGNLLLSFRAPAASRELRRLAWTSAAGEGQASQGRGVRGARAIQSDCCCCSSLFRREARKIQSWVHSRFFHVSYVFPLPRLLSFLSFCLASLSVLPLFPHCCLFSSLLSIILSLRLLSLALCVSVCVHQLPLIVSWFRLHSRLALIYVFSGLGRRLARTASLESSTPSTLASVYSVFSTSVNKRYPPLIFSAFDT